MEKFLIIGNVRRANGFIGLIGRLGQVIQTRFCFNGSVPR